MPNNVEIKESVAGVRSFLLAHPKLAVTPGAWNDPKAAEAAALSRDASEAILWDRPLVEYEAAARLALAIYDASNDPLPNVTRKSDQVFNLLRVSAPPSGTATMASVIAAAEIIDVGRGVNSRSDDGVREQLASTLANLALASAIVSRAIEEVPIDTAPAKWCITDNEPKIPEKAPALPRWIEDVRAQLQAFFGLVVSRTTFGKHILHRWITVHRLFFALMQQIAICLLLAKRLAAAGRQDLATSALISATALLRNSAELFRMATPPGWQYRWLVRPFMIRIAPTISGGDGGDHHAMKAALNERWPDVQQTPEFASAWQTLRSALSSAFANHGCVCRRAVSSKGASLRAKGMIEHAKPGWIHLAGLRKARLVQAGQPTRCPITRLLKTFGLGRDKDSNTET